MRECNGKFLVLRMPVNTRCLPFICSGFSRPLVFHPPWFYRRNFHIPKEYISRLDKRGDIAQSFYSE